MAKCVNCQEELPEGGIFCPNCGTRVESVQSAPQPEPQPVQPAPQQPVYQQPAPQQPVYQQPAPQQPVYQQPVYQQPAPQPVYQQPVYQQPVARKKSVGLLIWSIIMIIMSACSCSLISLILSIVACAKVGGAAKAFTDDEEQKKKKSAKGLLITSVILYCLGFVLVIGLYWLIIVIGAGASLGDFGSLEEFLEQFENMYMLFRPF